MKSDIYILTRDDPYCTVVELHPEVQVIQIRQQGLDAEGNPTTYWQTIVLDVDQMYDLFQIMEDRTDGGIELTERNPKDYVH